MCIVWMMFSSKSVTESTVVLIWLVLRSRVGHSRCHFIYYNCSTCGSQIKHTPHKIMKSLLITVVIKNVRLLAKHFNRYSVNEPLKYHLSFDAIIIRWLRVFVSECKVIWPKWTFSHISALNCLLCPCTLPNECNHCIRHLTSKYACGTSVVSL